MKTSFKILLAAIGFAFTLNLSAQQQKHVVQAGETVYAIARKYNVNPRDIIQLNPSIGNGDKIIVGQTITLPINNVTESQPQPQHVQQSQTTVLQQQMHDGFLNSGCKEMYHIQKKDNLYRIALQFGLAIEEICAANPGLTPDSKLKKNEWLCIPFSRAERQAEAERLAAEKARMEAEAQAARKVTGKKHLNVAVILPLKTGGDKGNKMIEFYRGLLMAADSVKQQGTSVDIYAYHSGNTAADMRVILAHPEMSHMDMVFGPLESAQATTLNEFCMEHKILLITPFSTTNTYGQHNPYTYQASITSEAARRVAVDKVLGHFTHHNYIILHTNNADGRGTQFTQELRNNLTQRGQNAHTLNINADEDAFIATMSKTRTNIIIPDASSLGITKTMAQRLRDFKQEHPEFKISILGYPEWPTYVGSLLNTFYELDTYAYTTFYRAPNSARVRSFEARFVKNFQREVTHTFPRYGLFGFDLGYYFMNGVSRLGDFFEEKQQSLNYHPLQNGFSFEQANKDAAHVNQQIILIHYTNNQKVEVIQ